MPRLKKTTLTDKLETLLEKEIRSGTHVAGRRLPSTRRLALRFGVSQQVVKSAFAELEAKQLVLTRERDGVYVNPEFAIKKRLEFAILTNCKGSDLDYASKLLRMEDSRIWESVRLTRRNICEEFSDALLRYELASVAEDHPDCLIAFLPRLQPESMKFFDALPFPVVFIGDFASWIPDASFKHTQILEDTSERGEAFVEAASLLGAKSALCLTGPVQTSYSQDFHDGASRKAKELGMRLEHAFYPPNSASEEEKLELWRAVVAKAFAGKKLDAALFDGTGDLEPFAKALSGVGLRLGEDVAAIVQNNLVPCSHLLENNYDNFAKSFLEIAKSLATKTSRPGGRATLSGAIERRLITIGAIRSVL